MLFIPWEGGRLQGAGALRCHTFPRRALDRQLEISRLLPATNGEGFSSPPPPFCLLHFRGKRKESFLGLKINKASQQSRSGESKGSSSRAFKPKN